jgi:broad specificity phosphatase PhoE
MLRHRAERPGRIEQFIEPNLKECRGQPPTRQVFVVAHGIFNAEFIGALLARRKDSQPLDWGYRGASEQSVPVDRMLISWTIRND